MRLCYTPQSVQFHTLQPFLAKKFEKVTTAQRKMHAALPNTFMFSIRMSSNHCLISSRGRIGSSISSNAFFLAKTLNRSSV